VWASMRRTARQTYYLCLLFYVGCSAGAEMAAEVFGGDHALTAYATPVRFGAHTEMLRGMARAVAPPEGSVLTRAVQLASGLPKLAREFRGHVAAACEVGRMLSERLGLPAAVGALFAYADERWDGKGIPGRAVAAKSHCRSVSRKWPATPRFTACSADPSRQRESWANVPVVRSIHLLDDCSPTKPKRYSHSILVCRCGHRPCRVSRHRR